MKRSVQTLLLLSLPLPLASAALAAPQGVALARVGDVAPGGATVTGFSHLRANDAGSWVAYVHTDSTASPTRLFRDGEQVLAIGDPAGGGYTVRGFVDTDLNDVGQTASIIDTGDRLALFLDGEFVLAQGQLCNLLGVSAAARYSQLKKVNLNAAGRLILRCVIADPLSTPVSVDSLVELEVDASGAILSGMVVIKTTEVLAGQSDPVFVFGEGDNQLTYQDNRSGTWSGRLAPGATPGEHITYIDISAPIFQGGASAPVFGRTYADVPVRASAFTNSGSWAISALLDSSNTDNDELIVVDGTFYAREGGNLLAFAGAPAIESLGRANLFLTDQLEPIFYVDTAGDMASDEAIVRGGEVVLREGNALAGGEIVTGLADLPFAFHASDSGEYVIAQAALDGGPIALVYVQAELGEPYCAAELNSTGGPSVTVACGTSLVSANALVLKTTSLPAGSFAYYLSSLTPGNVLFPGGSDGRICLSGSVGRHIDGVGTVAPNGTFSYQPDLTNMPTSPNVAVMAGDTWHHQLWHRDVGPTSNFSLPVRVTYH